jgi:hypothetical protein
VLVSLLFFRKASDDLLIGRFNPQLFYLVAKGLGCASGSTTETLLAASLAITIKQQHQHQQQQNHINNNNKNNNNYKHPKNTQSI